MNSPLITIVGPTGSGKSTMAHSLAIEYGVDIICADSQTLRRSLDIGTAKPTLKEREEATYYGLDLIDPYDLYSAADFKDMATNAISQIAHEKKVPVLVGGTGLYIDSVLYDYTFRVFDNKNQEQYEKLDTACLQQKITDKGYALPENRQNKRHLVSVLLSNGVRPQKTPLRQNTLVLGIALPDEVLRQKIQDRVSNMLARGLVDECRQVLDYYGAPPVGWRVLGYSQVFDFLINGSTKQDALEADIVRAHWQYARRQKTWFKRSKDIYWVQNYAQAKSAVNNFMQI